MRCGKCVLGGGRLTVLAVASLACAQFAAAEPPAGISDIHFYFSKVEHPPAAAASWGYTGDRGPAFWGRLSPKYRLADVGRRQSPIDLELNEALAEPLPPLGFAYRMERIRFLNNGHTIQHDGEPGSHLYVGDRSYALEQFHVHTPSEHTINGRHTDMEIHFVHKSKSGEVAVVAVMADAGPGMAIDFPLYRELPKAAGETVEADDQFCDPTNFLPADRRYLTYSGSFTTPPCTEGVRWFVLKSPVTITPATLSAFQQILGHNNRPVQDLYGREVRREVTAE